MAQYDVVVKAVDKTQGTFKGIESGLKNIESVAKNVQNILAGLITAQAVKSFINAGQELETIQRRLAALSPAGTDVSALFNSLATLSNRLGTGTTDLANAYLILRNNGIQPSVESLTTLNNIAKVSGGNIASIADAIGNVADGERLKALENATNGLIKIDDVLNQYGASTGQFAVKYQGQTVAIVKSTQEALNAINQIGAVNLNKPASETDTLTQAWNRFTNQLGLAAKTLLEGGLEAGLIRVVNKATELLLKIQPLLPALGQDLKSALETAAGALDLISRNIGIVISALDILFKLLIANAVITFVGGIINAAAALRVLAAGAAAAGIAATSASVGFAGLATTIAATVKALGPARVALTAIAIALAGWEIYKGVVDKSTDSTDAQTEALKGVNAELERQRKIQEDLAKGLPGLPATGSLQAPASKPLAPSVLNALQQLQKQASEAEQAIKVLEPALMKALSTGNLNEYNRIFNALKSNYELLGRNVLPAFEVAAKNAFNELNKSVGEDVQRLGVLEANLGRVTATFGSGSPIVQQYKDQIDELRKKFDPLAPSIKTVEDRQLAYTNSLRDENRNLALTTESLGFLKQALDQNLISYDRYIEKLGAVDSRLLTVTQRQALFDGALKKEKDALDLQAESLTFLAAALERGAIGYDRYIEKLGQIDSKLLSATQKQELFNAAISKGLTDSAVQAEQAGQALAEAYATGDIERFLTIYEQYKNVLGATATGELAAATKASNIEVDLLNKKKRALDQLIDNYKKAGGTGTEAFRKTAEALGANATQIDLVVARYGDYAEQVRERNDAIKKSIFDASGTFVDEFTKAFIAGKNILDSFKNFFVNILNSIAAELIKQQIAKPIAALLGNFIGDLIPGLAAGGIARGNQAYIVGEQGPELFVPGRTGRVVPNDTLSSTMSAQDDMNGGALNVNFTINAVDTQTGVQFLLQNKPVITSMISDAYNRRGRRGPLD